MALDEGADFGLLRPPPLFFAEDFRATDCETGAASAATAGTARVRCAALTRRVARLVLRFLLLGLLLESRLQILDQRLGLLSPPQPFARFLGRLLLGARPLPRRRDPLLEHSDLLRRLLLRLHSRRLHQP